jgi:hypothetical protein
MDHITIDSCHSRWVFDTEHRRFRRILKGLAFGAHAPKTDWRPYHELYVDPYSDSFTVVLDESGTRMLRLPSVRCRDRGAFRRRYCACPGVIEEP